MQPIEDFKKEWEEMKEANLEGSLFALRLLRSIVLADPDAISKWEEACLEAGFSESFVCTLKIILSKPEYREYVLLVTTSD